MILSVYQTNTQVPEGWTLDASWFGGPDIVGDWHVLLMQRDGTYLVQEASAEDCEEREVYRAEGNKDAATEHFLLAVRRLLMAAQGTPYPDGEPPVG